jgi:hypothetical protein
MITKKGRFLIRYEEIDKEFLKSFDFRKLEGEYKEIKRFYSSEKNLPIIRICFLYSPEEFLFFTGKEFRKDWSAMVGYHTTINLFSPSVIEKFTIHKKEKIFGILVHELSHLFYGYSGLVNLPLFNEGIAEYHSNKVCKNKINFNLPSLKAGKDMRYNYGVGHLLICSIMIHFGSKGAKKIMDFLKKVSIQMSEKELFGLFEDVFGMSADFLIELKGGKEDGFRKKC